MKNCKNCDTSFDGKYCPNCGQNSDISEINFKEIFSFIANEVFSIDSKLVKTFKSGFFESGTISKAYIRGKRKSYINPISYYFISISLLIITMNFFAYDYIKLSNDSISTFSSGTKQFTTIYRELKDSVQSKYDIVISKDTNLDSLINESRNDSVLQKTLLKASKLERAVYVQKEMPNLIVDNYKLFNFLIFLPLPLLLRLFLSKKKYPQTMAQLYVFAIYNVSHINLIMVPFHIINHYVMDFRFLFLPQAFTLAYTVYSCRIFFNDKTFFKSIIFAFSYVLMFLIFMLLVSLGTFVYIMMNF